MTQTYETLNAMMHRCINRATAIGIEVRPCKLNTTFPKVTSYFANCNKAGATALISFSQYYLDADPAEIEGTMMHEVLHACRESGYGHGVKWKRLAYRINQAYPEFAIKCVGSQLAGKVEKGYDLKKVAIANGKKVYKITCPECGHVWEYTRKTSIFTRLNHCSCPYCHHEGLESDVK